MKLIEVYIDNEKDNNVVGIIWQDNKNRFITTHASSSMGFDELEDADRWLAFTCKDIPLITSDTIKLVPEEILQEAYKD